MSPGLRMMSFALVTILLAALDAMPLPIRISPNDPSIRLVGRWDTRDVAGPRGAWAGSSLVAKFQGAVINVMLKGTGPDHLEVLIDGQPASVVKLENGKMRYQAVTGLADKEHTIEVFKRTEPLVGTVQFLGFELSKGTLLPLAPRPKRRIEFVGDSITCGYGIESVSETETFTPETENNYLAYGALAARALSAEYVAIAWSSKELLGKNAIPLIYDRTLPDDSTSKWDFTQWTADVVVINLGTNDFSEHNPSKKEWTDAYRDFIKRLRRNYPRCHVFVTLGPMMRDEDPPGRRALSTLRGYNRDLIATLAKEGDQRVHYLEFPRQDPKNGLGADSHPSAKTHSLMADELVHAIKKELGW